jgi:hypothetical protein
MDEDIIAILAIFLCVFTPIAGLTLRFALKPLVDSIARLLEARSGNGAQATAATAELAERRIALLEQELGMMRVDLQRVTEQKDFMERLTAGR